jgi:hypothetical protein
MTTLYGSLPYQIKRVSVRPSVPRNDCNAAIALALLEVLEHRLNIVVETRGVSFAYL